MASPKRQAKGSALVRPRFASLNCEGASRASPDLQPRPYDVEGRIGGELPKPPSAAAMGSIRRVLVSSLAALFLGGLVFLAVFPALSYTQQELARYYSDRAKVSNEARDFARSVMYWQRSIWAEPADPNARFGLAKAYEGLGAEDEAVREYQLAIKMDPQIGTGQSSC